jgi:fructoselysine-6-P-deglycase FrlB-like protein
MSEMGREIATQPGAWRRAAIVAQDSIALLPARGTEVAVIGCGTSYYMAQAYAAAREAAGHGLTDAFVASEVPTGRRYDRVVAISRSGTTTEVVRALNALPPGTPTLAISAVADSPVTTAASAAVVLDFADEQSVVQTRFATSALALLRAHLGDDVEPLAAEAEAALERPLPVEATDFDHFVFLGRGWSVGLANEAALKLREAGGAWTEAYPAMEYRHGPISVAGRRSVVWPLGAVARDLLEEVSGTGATVVTDGHDPMVTLVLAQRLAVSLAESRGLDPDRPRHLTRSVVLEDG